MLGLSRTELIAILACGTIGYARAGRGPAGSARGHSAAAGPAEMQIEGAISKQDGKYFLVDEATGQRFELRGAMLERHFGERLAVRGTVTSESASGGPALVMTVSETRPIAAAGAGGKAAAAAVSTGFPRAAILGIGAGAVGGATIGGLYAAKVIGGDEQAASPE